MAETELVENRMTDQENIEQVKTLTVSQEEKVHLIVLKILFFLTFDNGC